MGKAVNPELAETIEQSIRSYPAIRTVRDLMVHDYGFGHFMVSMRAEGRREDRERLYTSAHAVADDLRRRFGCDCLIQVDHLIDDAALSGRLLETIGNVLQPYDGAVTVDQFRLLEGGGCTTAAFDFYYPTKLQDQAEAIGQALAQAIENEAPQFRAVINGILRREHCRSHR